MNAVGGSSKSGRGFTLIELIVVVATLAVLVALILPSLGSTLGSARRVQCAYSLRSLTTALNQYADTNQQLPVTSVSIGFDLAEIRTSARHESSQSQSMQLLVELSDYLDAPLPTLNDEKDVVADQPWICPDEKFYVADAFEDDRPEGTDGFSYDYYAATQARPEAYPDSLRYNTYYVPTARGIGRDAYSLYLSSPGLVILADERAFHTQSKGNSGGRNHAAFDGSVKYVPSR